MVHMLRRAYQLEALQHHQGIRRVIPTTRIEFSAKANVIGFHVESNDRYIESYLPI